MDSHMIRAHPLVAGDATGGAGVCLADHCELFGCPAAAVAAVGTANAPPSPHVVAACEAILGECFAAGAFLNATRVRLCEGTLTSKAAAITKPIWTGLKKVATIVALFLLFCLGLRTAYLQDLSHPITTEGVNKARISLEAKRAAARSMKEVAKDAAAASGAKPKKSE